MGVRGFQNPSIPSDEVDRLGELASVVRGDILAMTTLAGTGHLGGALSSADIFLTLWSYANVSPSMVDDPSRDRIVISHGHTAPAVYAVLGRFGYFEPQQAICSYRRNGSPFEGHADPKVPGVEWACGNLGQGLSAACGMALASGLTRDQYRVFCVMGDGEQQKGQISEARRFAVKYRLHNLTAIIDCNHLQATGSVDEIMHQDLSAEWQAAGWNVISVDGHNHSELYTALHEACRFDAVPTVILAITTMGKGVASIENRYEYHGKTLSRAECEASLCEMGLSTDMLRLISDAACVPHRPKPVPVEDRIAPGIPRIYNVDTDCRTAFGNALADIARGNENVPIAVFDCDLSVSVKTDGFAAVRPEAFFQCGIQEHSTASMAGAVSKSGVLSFFAEFGVFGLDETYNQHRLNDINVTSIKLILTHCGLDVGEDGKTHQCIDYIGLASNLYGFKLIIAADANHADKITRYVASTPGRFIMAMGRSKTPVITDENGILLYGESYAFQYGRSDWVRQGSDAAIITTGNMVSKAVVVRTLLAESGFSAAVINVSCPFELDDAVIEAAVSTGLVITYEDHHARTGLGSLVASHIAEYGLNCRLMRFGITKYGVSGSPEYNYQMQGLDVESVYQRILGRLHNPR
ncbi:MAG: transketolase [Armatimonadota bacterium]